MLSLGSHRATDDEEGKGGDARDDDNLLQSLSPGDAGELFGFGEFTFLDFVLGADLPVALLMPRNLLETAAFKVQRELNQLMGMP